MNNPGLQPAKVGSIRYLQQNLLSITVSICMVTFSRFKSYLRKNRRYAPVFFFICGFTWDTLTLGRIDRLYDRVVLLTHLSSLTACLYLYNLADDGKWEGTLIGKYQDYLPLAIQFFLGGLCSAFVIYFSRSVSFTKTLSFFVILVVLLFANELLKKRISNKYLQFSAYFFVNFTFFTFFLPVLVKSMNTFVFLVSGAISLSITLALIIYIYRKSPSTRAEISKRKMLGLIAGIYLFINTFYFFNLIPPVPLALKDGLVAYNVERVEGGYEITHERAPRLQFWKNYSSTFYHTPGERIYVYTSIFAPTAFNKTIAHRWKWRNPVTDKWEITDRIDYQITGGREGGFRGFTFKSGVIEGRWRVEVVTENNRVIGIVNFEVVTAPEDSSPRVVRSMF